jgi:hypothetical protein
MYTYMSTDIHEKNKSEGDIQKYKLDPYEYILKNM